MKTSLRKYLSLVMVLMVAFVCLFGVSVKAATDVARFEFGANGTASHKDGSDMGASKSFDDGSYTLAISNASKVYSGAYDAKGNSCLKLGTSSAVGSFNFTVPNDITQVVIFAAQYKANTTNISVNGTAYTLTKSSNNGAYDEIVVDTTTNKTVIFTTVSGGVRCMINTIVFYAEAASTTPSVNIDGGDYTEVDDVVTLTAKVEHVEGTVVWSSSNTAVATVDQNGDVTAKSMGTTTITATVGEVSDSLEFKVFPTDGASLTVTEAIDVCKLAGNIKSPFEYKTKGVVSDVSYSEKYSNYTFILTDESGTIKVYGATGDCEPQEGYVVEVSGALINYDNSTPEFNTNSKFKLVVDDSFSSALSKLNSIETYMSLAYTYGVTQQEVAAKGEVTDVLNLKFTGVSAGTNYTSWSGKQSESSAVWSGQSAGDKSSIQLRSKNSNSGVVTTVSGGRAAKIIVTWQGDTAAGRTLDIYGAHKAYTNPTELYNTSTQGTKLGSIVKGTSTEFEISGDYEYIGLRSNDGAMYITEIQVIWEVEAEGTTLEDAYTDVDFRFRFGVDSVINEFDEYDSFGIRVTANGKTKDYEANDTYWEITEDNKINYVIVSLGDVLTNKERLDVEFTVAAYVEVEGVKYISEFEKTYSVASLVQHYYETLGKVEVEPLYNLLVELGKISK